MGLLQKAEQLASRGLSADDLILESRGDAQEELSEIPSDSATMHAALKFERRAGASAIYPRTGRVVPGRAEAHGADRLARVPTGIPGLDEHINGGFVRNSVNLVTGSPGAGKTIFALQFLMSGIQQGEPGLFISFEERKENFYKYVLPFGWDLAALDTFTFFRFSPEHAHEFLNGTLLEDAIRAQGVKRVVVDSVTAFTLLARDELAARESLVALFDRIASWGVTVVVIAEHEPHPSHEPGFVEFSSDSIIALYSFRRGHVRQRVVEVIKMRGTPLKQQVFPMKMSEDGITIYSEES